MVDNSHSVFRVPRDKLAGVEYVAGGGRAPRDPARTEAHPAESHPFAAVTFERERGWTEAHGITGYRSQRCYTPDAGGVAERTNATVLKFAASRPNVSPYILFRI